MVKLLGAVGRYFVPHLFWNARSDFLEFLPYRLLDRSSLRLACGWPRGLGLLLLQA